MQIIKAQVLGFCMGVKRAVSSAEEALSLNKKVFTLGPLIHNPSVLNTLTERGVQILSKDNMSLLDENSIVVIRAHGTSPDIIEKLNSTKATIVNSTCPRVSLSQKRAAEWSEKGYMVIIAGDKNHGEVSGICGYSSNASVVIQNEDEAKKLEVPEKSILLSQTTFSPAIFLNIQKILEEKNKNLVVFNSICSATYERQNALRNLEGKVDGILVIGGKLSANTRRLFEIAQSICNKSALIEGADEIPEEFYGLEKVGITAGASTPDYIINEVEKKLITKNGGIIK